MADLSIIVLSRNQAYFEQLDACLDEQDADVGVDLLLVNNSNDPRLTASALKRGWMVVEPGYNTSFSTGNNLAVRALNDARWLLLLNDDIRPSPSFLHELWRQREAADIHGALLLHTDRTVNHAGIFIRPGETGHIGRYDAPESYRGRCRLVAGVTFASALIYRGLWEKLGGLDESYYYGWEDLDLCVRALQAGATVRCNGDAIAIHDECGTRPREIGDIEMENYRLFWDRWEAQLPGILTQYTRRMRPEEVEGV